MWRVEIKVRNNPPQYKLSKELIVNGIYLLHEMNLFLMEFHILK